jgi:hypothetical protein
MMTSKRQRRLAKTQEQYNAQLRKINKVVDDYCYKEKSAKECMKRIVDIVYKTNGNTVPRSRGAKPMMDLPEAFPTDINYEWYEEECRDMLMAVGAIKRPVMPVIPRKNSKAWVALKDAGKIKEGKTEKARWVWVI